MDCTVDSIFTTTPFFKPREGCEPMPMISIAPSGVISPTRASTFEVPISRPTMTSRSDFFLAIKMGVISCPGQRRGGRAVCALPSDREAIAIAHVDVADVTRTRAHQGRRGEREAGEARIEVAAPEPHGHTVG